MTLIHKSLFEVVKMGKLFKLFVGLVISFSLFAGWWVFPPPQQASAITDHWMEVLPRKVDTGATYRFHFTIEKKLLVHDWIKLWWPVEVTFPKIPEDPSERKKELTRIIESMSIGLSPCSACQGLPVIVDTPTEKSISFNSHIELNPEIEGYKDIVITVPDVVGITNPKQTGEYVFKIANKVEPTPVPSAPFKIVESKIGQPEGMPVVEVTPPSFRSHASYKVTFNVGEGGWLKAGNGILRFRFPEETVFSRDSIAENAILVNGTPLTVRPIPRKTGGFYLINLNTPVEIPDSGKVEVLFTERAGIINPARPGSYKIEISTMPGDPDWVSSFEYNIIKGGAILSVEPPKVNKNAEYSFAFVLDENENLKRGDRLQVLFPEGTQIPETISTSNISINDASVTNVSISKLELTLYSSADVGPGETCVVRFAPEAGIINTKSSGEVKLGYKFFNAKEYLFTMSVNLTESQLEATEVLVEPRNANSIGAWTIAISIGDNGSLAMGDYIGIEFPENTGMPTAIDAGAILINDNEADKVEIKGTAIHAYVSKPISGGNLVNIFISREAGIENPDQEKNDYYLQIYTSKEPNPVKTDIFNITPSLPRTQIQISGGQLGRDNWYLEPPLVAFTCSSPSADIFVYFDDKIDQTVKYDGSPKSLELGQFVTMIHYYAVDVFGTEEVKSIEVKVDNVPPEIEITSPAERRILTREKKVQFSGRSTEIKTIRYGIDVMEYDRIVYINDIPMEVNEKDGHFGYEFDLKEGENNFLIRAEDEAGNFVVREYAVVLDSIPPQVDITNPAPGSVVTSARTSIKGKTETDAQLTINGEIVYIEPDGSFEHDIRLSKVGKAQISIEAVDPTGNVTEIIHEFWFGYTIVLQIGNKTGKTNEVEKTLDVPPFISQGRTLVPFRFIGEQLNAQIDYTINPSTRLVEDVIYQLGSTRIVLTIGKTEATVNGNKVKMDVPAQIVSGRTVVPIRFVTEALGCKVDWEGKQQIITITYPVI